MSHQYSEDALIEQATEDVLKELGWTVVTAWNNETFGENGLLSRENKSEVILVRDLLRSLQKLNPNLPQEAYQDAVDQLVQKKSSLSAGKINQEKYELLRNGVSVTYHNSDGEVIKEKLRVFDFQNIENNRFLAVRQLEVVGELYSRRPDVVGFVNGIPLVFFELKAHAKDLRNAYEDNLKDYKVTIPELFH